MVTRPSGYNEATLLEISCEEFKLSISGKTADKKSLDLNLNKNIMAELLVSGKYLNEVEVKSSASNGELIDSKDGVMLPSFYENGNYEVVLQNEGDEELSLYHYGSSTPLNFRQYGNVKVGTISFDSDIGFSSFKLQKGKEEILSFVIEVFPSKLDYKEDYKEILQDINNEVTSLAFQILGKTYLSTVLKDTTKQTNAEYINILQSVFSQLERDIKRIVKSFKHSIVTVERLRSVEKAKKVSRKTINYIRKNPSVLLNSPYDGVPSKVIENRKVTTIDIYENRYVKYIIKSIIRRLYIIERNIINAGSQNNSYLGFIKEKKKLLEQYLKVYFSEISDLTEQRSMSLVFQLSPGYKEIYRKYIILKKGLALGDDLFRISPKKLYHLYEMWCYIKIHHLLSEIGYNVKEHGIVKYRDNGLYLSLLQDKTARTIYTKGDNELTLWYQKSYSVPTATQDPDTVLCIGNEKDKNHRIYVFDAKYRINTDSPKVGPMVEDINVMHRYRDAIVSKLSVGHQFKYETFGAYVMFPYSNEEEYKNHQFYKSIETVNIGALPMLPGSTSLMKKQLSKIVNESLLEAKDSRVLLDEEDNYSKFKNKNVIIANVHNEDHYKAYKEHKFYHIPQSKLSKLRLGVNYIAFYKSINNFGEESGIYEYAPIINVGEYNREECLEIPCRKGKEKEKYLRFELGDFKRIKRIEPIQSGRLTSYTTLYLLKNASNAHMLYIKNSYEIKVYKVLKSIRDEQGYELKKVYSKDENISEYMVNGKKILIEDNKIRVEGLYIKLEELKDILQ